MDSDLQKQIKTLPREILYLLTAEKAVDLSVMLSERYRFNQDQIGAFANLIAKLYLKELRLSDLFTQVKIIFTLDEPTTKALCRDIAGFKLLVVSDWLGEDVANYIRSLGGDINEYSFENQELRRLAAAEMAIDDATSAEPELASIVATDDELDDPVEESDDDAVDETEALSDAETELVDSETFDSQFVAILSDQLTELLSTDDNLFIQEFNGRIIGILGADPDMKNELINALMKNQSRLSGESIVLDGRQVEPTVSNWIKYYITSKGSSMIDSVALSDFLVNSSNARFLNNNEKLMLSRLLQLYSNIKFFPDSLVGDNPDNWIVMPLSNEANHEFIKLVETPEMTPVLESHPLETTKPVINKGLDTGKLNSLRQLAASYAVGSLERLALEEEIKRLSAI